MRARPRASRRYALLRIFVTLAVVGLTSIRDAQPSDDRPPSSRIETLRWRNSDPDPARIEGFVVHYGPASRSYNTSVDAGWFTPDADGIFSYDLTLPDDARVYVAITAYDAELESDYSNERLLAPEPDFDGDGVGDTLDNCSEAPNPQQNDTDADDCGNLCDADYDQNGTVEFLDFGFFRQCYNTTNELCQHYEPIGEGRTVGMLDFGFYIRNLSKTPGPSGTTAGTIACPL
jgi:hypothetical protein